MMKGDRSCVRCKLLLDCLQPSTPTKLVLGRVGAFQVLLFRCSVYFTFDPKRTVARSGDIQPWVFTLARRRNASDLN